MSYLVVHLWPGGTEDQYRATVAAVHPDGGLPEGQVHHAAGPADGGYLISSIWNSKEDCDRFVSEVLLAGPPPEGGFSGEPQVLEAEIANLQEA